MSDIITFRPKAKPEPLVWVCNCRCTTHYHHATGDVECGSCGNVSSEANGSWRSRLPPAPEEAVPMPDEAFKVTDATDFETFLRRQIIASRKGAGAGVIVMFADGTVATWGDRVAADDRFQWFMDGVAGAVERMTGRKP